MSPGDSAKHPQARGGAQRRRRGFRLPPGPVLDGEGEPNTWLPFGGGAHRCIGAGFALMDRTAVLREVLTRHTLAPADSHPERGRVRNITTVPRGKARIVVTPQ